MAQETKLTAEGVKKLQAELEERITIKRVEITERLKEARAQGDLSENAEYDQAREDQGFNEGRIQELEHMLKSAVVVENTTTDKDVVNFGAVVVLEDLELGEKETFTIVGTAEADPFANKISNDSPVGNAILKKRVGEIVPVPTPAGHIEYKIVEILNNDN